MKRSIAKLRVPGTSIFQESSPPWSLPRHQAGQELLGGRQQLALKKCYSFLGKCETEWENWSLEMNSASDHGHQLSTGHQKALFAWAPWGCTYQRLSFPIRVCPPRSLKTDLSVYIIILKGRSVAIQKNPGDGGGNGRGDFNTTHVFSLYSLQEVWLPTDYLECYPRNNAGIVRSIFLPLLYESVIKQRRTGIRWWYCESSRPFLSNNHSIRTRLTLCRIPVHSSLSCMYLCFNQSFTHLKGSFPILFCEYSQIP